jgi:NADH-quinone oxidoreductase subunit J
LFASVLFFSFAAVVLGAALGVILSRNPVHSALCLVLCFFASAVIWLLLEAEFLAIVLVLVYVGAVMVLFLFVVMMLDVNLEELRRGIAGYWPFAAAVLGFLVFAILNVILAKHLGGAALRSAAPRAADYSDATALGTVLFTRYAYAAQLAAVILLIASIAAIVLTLRHRPGLKSLNVTRQIAVRREDRVRIVEMPAEKAP